MGTKRMLNVGQAADYIGAHPHSIRKWSDRGLVQVSRTPGGHRRFSTDDLDDLIRVRQPERPRSLTLPIGTGVFQYGLAAGIGEAHRPDPQAPVSAGLSALDQHVVLEAAGLRD